MGKADRSSVARSALGTTIAALLVLASPYETSAQTCTSPALQIPCGERQVGAIAAGEVDCFTFTANGGEKINLALWHGMPAPDETLRVLDPNSDPVSQCGPNTGQIGIYCDITLPAMRAGTYTVQVFDAGANDPFNYALTMQGVSQNFTCGSPMVCGEPKPDSPGSLAVGETDSYTFLGISGERVNIDLSLASAGGVWRLHRPDGDVVGIGEVGNFCPSYCSATLPQTNPPSQSGNYTIIVVDGNVDQVLSSYNLTFQGVSDGLTCGDPIGCGETQSGLIAGETDAYTFAGVAGEAVNIDLSEEPDGGVWQLFDPDGILVANGGSGHFCQVGYCDARLPGGVTKTGTYTIIVVDGGSNEPRSYNVTLQGLSDGICTEAPLLCEPVVSGGPLLVGDTDAHRFLAGASPLVISLTEGSPSDAVWRLYDPNGVPGAFCPGTCTAGTAPGLYTLIVVDGFSNQPVPE